MKSLKKVFKIIEILKDIKEARLYEIADMANINKSTAHRILNELVKEGYIQVNEEDKKYSLGMKFLEISNVLMENLSLINASKEIIDDLNNTTKETVHLVLLMGDKAIYIDKRESKNSVRMYSRIGLEVPFYAAAVGKVILAEMPEINRNEMLNRISFKKYTKKTILDLNKLREEIKKIKQQGYAIDHEEMQENIVCIAAAIKNYTESVVGALSITLTLYSENIKRPHAYKDMVMDAAKKISSNLGFIEKRVEY